MIIKIRGREGSEVVVYICRKRRNIWIRVCSPRAYSSDAFGWCGLYECMNEWIRVRERERGMEMKKKRKRKKESEGRDTPSLGEFVFDRGPADPLEALSHRARLDSNVPL